MQGFWKPLQTKHLLKTICYWIFPLFLWGADTEIYKDVAQLSSVLPPAMSICWFQFQDQNSSCCSWQWRTQNQHQGLQILYFKLAFKLLSLLLLCHKEESFCRNSYIQLHLSCISPGFQTSEKTTVLGGQEGRGIHQSSSSCYFLFTMKENSSTITAAIHSSG